MNCQSCGGPLHESIGRGRVKCSYCGTIQIPSSESFSIDRVIPLNQLGEMDCPTCAVQLQKAFVDDALAHFCGSCQGILMTREVFTQVVWERRSAFQGGEEIPLPVDVAALQERIHCPQCQGIMDCHPYYGPGNAIIDSCLECHLVWLDMGELTTLERAPGQRKLSR